MNNPKHTFVICAYKESIFLEECIQSLLNQTVKSQILLATSTPNDYITEIAAKYNIPVSVNTGDHGITQDWNFAYSVASTDYVTLAHQDDTYHKDYAKYLLTLMDSCKKPLIFFTDYAEIRNGAIAPHNRMLKIKSLMLFPLRPRIFWGSRFVRRRILSMGSPICCPSVTFVRKNLPPQIFEHGYRTNGDWQAWEKFSRFKGQFVFCNKILTYHRIHEESETSKAIQDNQRAIEDLDMFCRFWPKPIARMLAKFYGSAESSNEI